MRGTAAVVNNAYRCGAFGANELLSKNSQTECLHRGAQYISERESERDGVGCKRS